MKSAYNFKVTKLRIFLLFIMHFQKILPDSKQFIIINNIYESSFPIDERRDYENFINILNSKSNIFSLEAAFTENGEIVGSYRIGISKISSTLSTSLSMKNYEATVTAVP